MPFLFVDYDQGIGGEFFAAQLSQSDQCIPLEYTIYDNKRTKIKDIFHQEFLKPDPKIEVIASHPSKYTIVPAHRSTRIAYQLLSDVRSIRIAGPVDPKLFDYVIEQRVQKVLLSKEPTSYYFVGLLKILQSTAQDSNFLKKVKSDMDVLTIMLISMGVDPTEDNKNKYINKIRQTKLIEPIDYYDLIIPFDDIVYNKSQVQQQLKKVFDIELHSDWLYTYQKNYAQYSET